MDADLVLTIGLILGAFTIPAVVSDLSDQRAPRLSALTVLIAAGLILYALKTKPGGYTLAQLPDAFFSGLAQILP